MHPLYMVLTRLALPRAMCRYETKKRLKIINHILIKLVVQRGEREWY